MRETKKRKITMINEIWLVEDNYKFEAFSTLEKARDYATQLLKDDGYDPDNDKDGVFEELNNTYNDKNSSGFYVQGILYCYSVNYHS